MTLAVMTLQKHEAVIERGLATFVEVGEALLAIREQRLYLGEYTTFEAYCQDRWGWTRQRAHQQIQAAQVAGALSTTVDNEAQARELAPLIDDPEAMQAIMRARGLVPNLPIPHLHTATSRCIGYEQRATLRRASVALPGSGPRLSQSRLRAQGSVDFASPLP